MAGGCQQLASTLKIVKSILSRDHRGFSHGALAFTGPFAHLVVRSMPSNAATTGYGSASGHPCVAKQTDSAAAK